MMVDVIAVGVDVAAVGRVGAVIVNWWCWLRELGCCGVYVLMDDDVVCVLCLAGVGWLAWLLFRGWWVVVCV